jgi:hypothetical protein
MYDSFVSGGVDLKKIGKGGAIFALVVIVITWIAMIAILGAYSTGKYFIKPLNASRAQLTDYIIKLTAERDKAKFGQSSFF